MRNRFGEYAFDHERSRGLLYRWLARAGSPNAPFHTRAVVFLSLLIVPITAAIGHLLWTRNLQELAQRAKEIGMLASVLVIFAAVWHVMSRRNR